MKQLSWIVLFLTISTFSQTPGGGVTDIDGNSYNSVIIGTQEWMKENLNVSKYTDGTIIPQVTNPTQLSNLTTGAWCYYNNDPANGAIYGKLYNWYAVAGIYDAASLTNTLLRKQLAPAGYHIPTDAEWNSITTYLGGENVAGGAMKESGTTHWVSPNSASNSSGFSGLPGGNIFVNMYLDINYYCLLWSSSEYNTIDAWERRLNYDNDKLYKNKVNKSSGFSVRCLSDSSLSNPTFDTSSLQLYPNPVLSVLNVKVDSYLINQPYTIIDGIGRVVLNGKLNEFESAINIEQLSEGIYYLKIAGNSANKFIKK